ncbi:hypothetical protein COO60DRAFT_1144543 [Scenedesmus sp. NREL 46B-D3]|nr:hypothetical protein COO60DRAFT_1144543 [Scenedesmus sp. NREL 46B-D3]
MPGLHAIVMIDGMVLWSTRAPLCLGLVEGAAVLPMVHRVAACCCEEEATPSMKRQANAAVRHGQQLAIVPFLAEDEVLCDVLCFLLDCCSQCGGSSHSRYSIKCAASAECFPVCLLSHCYAHCTGLVTAVCRYQLSPHCTVHCLVPMVS